MEGDSHNRFKISEKLKKTYKFFDIKMLKNKVNLFNKKITNSTLTNKNENSKEELKFNEDLVNEYYDNYLMKADNEIAHKFDHLPELIVSKTLNKLGESIKDTRISKTIQNTLAEIITKTRNEINLATHKNFEHSAFKNRNTIKNTDNYEISKDNEKEISKKISIKESKNAKFINITQKGVLKKSIDEKSPEITFIKYNGDQLKKPKISLNEDCLNKYRRLMRTIQIKRTSK